jgi:SAM-dependent methyltransferase
MFMDPTAYEAWYHTPRGAWIGRTEFTLLMKLLHPASGGTLLDVGCGTGYFSRRFSEAGLHVTGIDMDAAMLALAVSHNGNIRYLRGSTLHLPFDDHSFDNVSAITSLCFVDPALQAIKEMWRVSRHAVVLGLLNRSSLLYHAKHDRGSYAGARWDSASEVKQWLAPLAPTMDIEIRSAIFVPSGNLIARSVEQCLPNRLPYGGFLAVNIQRAIRA